MNVYGLVYYGLARPSVSLGLLFDASGAPPPPPPGPVPPIPDLPAIETDFPGPDGDASAFAPHISGTSRKY